MGLFTKSLNQKLTKYLHAKGAALVGIADLTKLNPKSRWNYERGIVIALAFSGKAMETHKNGDPMRYYMEYTAINKKLTALAGDTVQFLKQAGYDAFAMLESLIPADSRLVTPLPYKTVATQSGMGWIGKCALLVTPEYGSAVRMTAVLTNAPLECGEPVCLSRCSEICRVCTNICPSHAIAGNKWRPGMARESFFNAQACFPYAVGFAKDKLKVDDIICGLCLCNCPWTKKAYGYL
ncbi:MAG: epoxyqueuosine reductase [Clostridiales bacterium]|jgi:epoxyqueuosine reductase QueG|nr:epoxyqueuosine reductase [Clostridiales bacterium]